MSVVTGIVMPEAVVDAAGGAARAAAIALETRHVVDRLGFAVLTGIGADTVTVLRSLGTPVAQYDGEYAHEVRARPGFENYQYSQSMNTIRPHTEAPGWSPPPRYLSLHCHRQARCGGGHTVLADGDAFVDACGERTRARLERKVVAFPSEKRQGLGRPPRCIHRPVLERRDGGRHIFRFSYNLFRYADYDPPMDLPPAAAADRDLVDLCRQMEEFSAEQQIRVLIPDGATLVFDNHRMVHARSQYTDPGRHLTRYWNAEGR